MTAQVNHQAHPPGNQHVRVLHGVEFMSIPRSAWAQVVSALGPGSSGQARQAASERLLEWAPPEWDTDHPERQPDQQSEQRPGERRGGSIGGGTSSWPARGGPASPDPDPDPDPDPGADLGADLDGRLRELVEAVAAYVSPAEALGLFVELETRWWLYVAEAAPVGAVSVGAVSVGVGKASR